MTLPTEPVPVGPELPGVIVDWISPINNSAISSTPRETLDRVNDTFERQINVAAQGDVCRVTYGTDRLGPQVLTGLNYGSGIVVVCVWGRGEVQAIRDLTVNNLTPPATVIATHYRGTTSQTVDPKLVAAFGALGITHTDALLGLAYSVIEFQSGADIGDIHAIVDGVKIYDPRDGTQTLGVPSTYKWSDCPALAESDLITNATYGLGAGLTWTSATTTANANDALVSGEKKRIVGITLDTRQSAEAWIDVLRAHAGCWVVRNGNTYKLIPDAAASSIATFGKNDIIKGSNKWSMLPVNAAPNVVEVTYTDTSAVPWATATAVYPANALPPSGEDLYISRRSYPGVTRYSQALREAIEFFNHSRLESLTEEFATYTPALTIEPGDVIRLNNGGLSAGIDYRVLSKPMARKGRFTIRGRKYDPAAFDSSAVAAPTTANTTLPSAGTPPSITNLTLTEEAVSVPSGALPLSKVRASWTGVTYPFFQSYKVVITNSAGVVVDEGNTTSTTYLSTALNAFSTYTVSVRVLSSVAQGSAVMGTITLVSLGIESLATVWSQYITSAAGWVFVNTETYKLWPGDTALRIRTAAAIEDVEANTYMGANQSTPGMQTQLLDASFSVLLSAPKVATATSPIYDMGVSRSVVFALFNLTKWLNWYNANLQVLISASDSPVMTGALTVENSRANLTGRYVQFVIKSRLIV